MQLAIFVNVTLTKKKHKNIKKTQIDQIKARSKDCTSFTTTKDHPPCTLSVRLCLRWIDSASVHQPTPVYSQSCLPSDGHSSITRLPWIPQTVTPASVPSHSQSVVATSQQTSELSAAANSIKEQVCTVHRPLKHEVTEVNGPLLFTMWVNVSCRAK